MKMFKSDNTASVHPKIIEKMCAVNVDHSDPYGYDPISLEGEKLIQALFGGDCYVSFVLNGTGANVIGLSGMLKPYQAVICADTAHIHVDECGAFERYTGSKILTVPHIAGKISPETIEEHLEVLGNEHHSQPKVISISQLTEWGTAYTVDEIKVLASFAHNRGLLLHVDGARIANAALSLGVSFKAMIRDTGVDMLSFGGAKNGMMYGEAIVSFNDESTESLKYIRKQGMQLMSKMRYIAAQYIGLLEEDLWKSNAKNANDCMDKLYKGLSAYPEIKTMYPPEGNMLFLTLPSAWIDGLLEHQSFYVMKQNKDEGMIRLVTSFDTMMSEVVAFLADLKSVVLEASSKV